AREEALAFRPIASGARGRTRHWNEVFGTGENKDVLLRRICRAVPVTGNALGRFPSDGWNTQAPPEAKWPVARSAAVGNRELRLETAAPRRQGNRYSEISAAGMQIRSEGLAD